MLGFSPAIETRFLKVKVLRCVGELPALGLLCLPDGCDDPKQLVKNERKGVYTLTLTRGEAFLRSSTSPAAMTSPLADPLASIGFDPAAIARILRDYPARVVEQWTDITLAARERHGASFFTSSPQAYFMDNVKAAAKDGRTPPDWWRDMRKQELQRERDRERAEAELLPDTEEVAFEEYLMTEAKEAFDRVMEKLAADLRQGGADGSRSEIECGVSDPPALPKPLPPRALARTVRRTRRVVDLASWFRRQDSGPGVTFSWWGGGPVVTLSVCPFVYSVLILLPYG